MILWTCLGLSLIVSLTVFILMFLLRKRSSGPLRDELRNPGWFDFDGPSFEICFQEVALVSFSSFSFVLLSTGFGESPLECVRRQLY